MFVYCEMWIILKQIDMFQTYFIFVIYVYECLSACMSVCVPHACLVPKEDRRDCWGN